MDRPNRNELVWQQSLLLAVAALIFFANLGSAPLFDEDEPKNAACGREMWLRGDWIVPTFNDELRTDKPILVYWLMLCSYTVFGVSEFAARFGSSLLAVVTTLCTYHLGRKLYDPEAGFWGALVLCTCLMFAAVGRSVTPDSTLICCTTGAFLAYVWATAARHGGRFGSVTGTPLSRRTWREFVPAQVLAAAPMYVAMGFAVLAKGPIGVLLPCTIVGLFLLIRQQLDHRLAIRQACQTDNMAPLGSNVNSRPLTMFDRAWRVGQTLLETLQPLRVFRGALAMRAPLGILIVAIIALPWYVAVGVETDGAWLAGFLGNHNVGRFLAPKENHSGPIVYYAPVVLLGTMPWSLFVPLSIWRMRKTLTAPGSEHASDLFLLCWAGAWIGFFSLASTKLPNYVLPAYPALALMIGRYLRDWRLDPKAFGARAFRNGCRLLAASGATILVGFPFAALWILPEEQWLALVGAIPLIGAAFAYDYACKHRRLHALCALSCAAVLLAITVMGICPTRVASRQDGPTFAKTIRTLPDRADAPLATYEYFAPNLVYYSGRHVYRLRQDDVAEFFAIHPNGLLLTRDDRLEQVTPLLPPAITILAQQRRFLRQHDLVLLGLPTKTVQPAGHAVVR